MKMLSFRTIAVYLFLLKLAVCAEDTDAFSSKFGWNTKRDIIQPVFERSIPNESNLRKTIDEWNRHRRTPVFWASTMRQIERFVEKNEFEWADLVESCVNGDIGVSESVSFFGKLKDGRFLVLRCWLGNGLTGVVWAKSTWERIEQLGEFDKVPAELFAIEDGVAEEGPSRDGVSHVAVVHVFSGGKSATRTIGYFSANPSDLNPKDKRIVFFRTLNGALNFGEPIVKLKYDLGIDPLLSK